MNTAQGTAGKEKRALTPTPPAHSPTTRRTLIGLIGLYAQVTALETGLAKIGIEIYEPIPAPRRTVNLILDLARIPARWTETRAGTATHCENKIAETMTAFLGTSEACLDHILATTRAWLPDDSPCDAPDTVWNLDKEHPPQ